MYAVTSGATVYTDGERIWCCDAAVRGAAAQAGDAMTLTADYDDAKTPAQAADLTLAMGATFDTATDSMEAIRNRGDVAWITGGGSTVSDADVPKFASSGIILPCWDPGAASLTCRFCIQRPNGDAYNFSTGGWETLTFVQVQASSDHYVEMIDLGSGAYASAPIRLVSVEQQVVVTYWDTTAAYGPSTQVWGL
jgi:hypothetical protein